jgi:UDP-N-acetylglucosamine acyltransferase
MIHQFCRVGRRAMLGGRVMLTQDVPPFCMLARTTITGPNSIGMRRAGLSPEARQAVGHAIKLFFFRRLSRTTALEEIAKNVPALPEIEEFVEFIETSKRGIASGERGGGE